MDDLVVQQHDELLANQPSGVEHDADSCPICTPGGEEELDTTYTQADIDAAVAAAVKPLEERLATLLEVQGEAEVEAKVAAAKAELETQIADLQGQLDTKVLEVEEARRQFTDLEAYLTEAAAEAAAQAEIASRREVRLSLVRDTASFPDEYIEANADRWAAMPDEAFELLVNDWRAIGKPAAAAAVDETTLPQKTVMVAAREEAPKTRPAFADILELAATGVDLKNLKGV